MAERQIDVSHHDLLAGDEQLPPAAKHLDRAPRPGDLLDRCGKKETFSLSNFSVTVCCRCEPHPAPQQAGAGGGRVCSTSAGVRWRCGRVSPSPGSAWWASIGSISRTTRLNSLGTTRYFIRDGWVTGISSRGLDPIPASQPCPRYWVV